MPVTVRRDVGPPYGLHSVSSLYLSPASATLSGSNIVSGLRDVEVRDPGPGRFLVRNAMGGNVSSTKGTGRSVYRRRSSLLFFHKNSLLCIPPFPKTLRVRARGWDIRSYSGENNGHKHQGTAFRGTRPVYTRAEPILMRWDRMAL